MPRIPRKLTFKYGKFFHVFNKFNPELKFRRKELQIIQNIIEEESEKITGVKIVASNILKNHYHLLLIVDEQEYKKQYPGEKRLGISMFMQRVNTKIAFWYNRRKHRHGKVFYDRYKAKLLETLEYFNKVFKYITDNAMKHYGIIKDKWKYSSYHFYNKTKAWMQGFITDYQKLIKKIYGVRPITLKQSESFSNQSYLIIDI